jgi:hypothetical protein
MEEELCGRVLNHRWKAPDYKERESTVSTEMCLHPRSVHNEFGLCESCDDANHFADMIHAFTPGGGVSVTS